MTYRTHPWQLSSVQKHENRMSPGASEDHYLHRRKARQSMKKSVRIECSKQEESKQNQVHSAGLGGRALNGDAALLIGLGGGLGAGCAGTARLIPPPCESGSLGDVLNDGDDEEDEGEPRPVASLADRHRRWFGRRRDIPR